MGRLEASSPELIDISSYDFKALIFDCDGTLAETAPYRFNSLKSALAEQGLELPTDWYRARLGLSREPLFDEFDAEFAVTIDRPAAIARSEEIYCDGSSPIAEITRVAGIAKHLRGQLPAAVASGGPVDWCTAP